MYIRILEYLKISINLNKNFTRIISLIYYLLNLSYIPDTGTLKKRLLNLSKLIKV